MESVVVEQDTGAAVDVGVRVLGLAVLLEDIGGDAAVGLNKAENGVLGNLGAGGSVVHQRLETGVGLAEDTVTVARNDTARVEGRPQVVLNVLLGVVLGDVVLHLDDPSEDLLGGKTGSYALASLELQKQLVDWG